MRLISSTGHHPLYSARSTRLIEQELARTLPPHELMARAGAAISRLTRAVAPHARSIWIACGPGNNGGDGLMAAAFLAPWAEQAQVSLTVSWCGDKDRIPTDARHAMDLAQQARVQFAEHPPQHCDVAIDALLGLGAHGHQPIATIKHHGDRRLQEWLLHARACADTLINVDLPTGLNADTGTLTEWPFRDSKKIAKTSINTSAKRQFTLTFLTLKPGLFTAGGKDAAGEVWFDDLGAYTLPKAQQPIPCGWLGVSQQAAGSATRHQTHKGSYGDVWILGGQGIHPSGIGMTGAAVLAGRAALHAGAGRVLVVPLGEPSVGWDPVQPELMFRAPATLHESGAWPHGTWVCGCGGGSLISAHLVPVLQNAQSLVLDADALNAVAQNPALARMLTQRRSKNKTTVLTPHPLEAARLLGVSAAQIQADRLEAAQQIARQFQAFCVLKGSGTVVCAADGLASINATGNARLATAGTGDVLAGMLGAALAVIPPPPTGCVVDDANAAQMHEVATLEAVRHAVHKHGGLADQWPPTTQLTAGRLAANAWQDKA